MGRSGRGGGGGGSRGGGFSGGGRSSGGFSGGFSSGRSGRSWGGSYGGSYRTRSYSRGPVFINMSSRHYGGRPSRYYGGGGGGCGTVFGVMVAIMIIIMVLFPVVRSSFGGGSTDIAASTVERQPLPAGSVNETGYYTDECGWISSESRLTDGLKTFYRLTGVQPYVYIASEVNGSVRPSIDEIQSYSETLYDQLFTDEAHFLLVFCDDGAGGYRCGYTVGSAAKTVMDQEAVGILNDYLDRYYNSDVGDEEFFSLSFEKTAERIMTVTKSPWPTVLIVVAVTAGVVLVVVLAFSWWKKAKAQKNLEDQRTAEILNTPLEKFGDDAAEELAKKYEQDGSAEDGQDE